MSDTPEDWLEDQPFYELMQAYRHARDPGDVVPAFEAVKSAIRAVAISSEAKHLREALEKDAARWRVMREKLIAIDWDWNGSGTVAVFECPADQQAYAGPECADEIVDRLAAIDSALSGAEGRG